MVSKICQYCKKTFLKADDFNYNLSWIKVPKEKSTNFKTFIPV